MRVGVHLLFLLVSRNIKENIKTSAKEILGLHELKQNKPWFDDIAGRKEAEGVWEQGVEENIRT